MESDQIPGESQGDMELRKLRIKEAVRYFIENGRSDFNERRCRVRAAALRKGK